MKLINTNITTLKELLRDWECIWSHVLQLSNCVQKTYKITKGSHDFFLHVDHSLDENMRLSGMMIIKYPEELNIIEPPGLVMEHKPYTKILNAIKQINRLQ
jgi:hypothetical protein